MTDDYRTRGNNSKPLRGASEQDRTRLGVLLQRRRSELGYATNGLQPFAREHGISWRGIYDIEKARRDGFMVSKLDEYARAYEVTYDSLVAVGRGEAAGLAAASAGASAALVTRVLHSHDREAIERARQSPLLDGPHEPGGAWDVITELLFILDEYLPAGGREPEEDDD